MAGGLTNVIKLVAKNTSKKVKPKATSKNNVVSVVSKIDKKNKSEKKINEIKNIIDGELTRQIHGQQIHNETLNLLKNTGKYPDFKVGEKIYFPKTKKTKNVKSLSFEGASENDSDKENLIKIGSQYYRPLIILDDGMRYSLEYLRDLKAISVKKNKGGSVVERNPYNYEPKGI